MHDSAAPIVSPCSRATVEDERLHRLLVLGEERPRMGGAQRFSDPVGLRLAPRRDHEVDLHLEVVRADRHFEPLGLSPGLRDDAGDR